MPDNVKITVNKGRHFTGRLVGFITETECTAAINIKDAARKISTEETMDRNSLPSVLSKKRFVVVTSDYNGDNDVYKNTKIVFISPKIKYVSYYSNDEKELTCEGNNVYQINFT